MALKLDYLAKQNDFSSTQNTFSLVMLPVRNVNDTIIIIWIITVGEIL